MESPRKKTRPSTEGIYEEEKGSSLLCSATGGAFVDDSGLEVLIRRNKKIQHIIYNALIEFPDSCTNEQCERIIREEEIISGWPKSLNSYMCRCPACKADFIPELQISYLFMKKEKKYNFYLLSPVLFFKEVMNLINFKGYQIFFTVTFFNYSFLLSFLV